MSEYTIEDVYAIAGKELSEAIRLTFPEDYEKEIINWFYYGQMPSFDDRTPREVCEQGQGDLLESRLVALLRGDVT